MTTLLPLADHDLAYQVRGEGPPVLLLGGSGEPMVAWELSGLVDRLVAAGRTVVWYAARGVVPSGCPPLPWSVDDLASDAIALAEHLGIAGCDAIGYSLGGFTLEALVRRRPDLVGHAVLMASAGTRRVVRDAVIDTENALVERYGEVPAEVSRLVTLMTALGGAELLDEERLAEWWALLAHQRDQWAAPHGEQGQAQAARSWSGAGGSARGPWPAEVRTSVVCFESDVLFPPDEAREVAAVVGASHVAVVPEAGHGGLVTRPDLTVPVLLELVGAPS